MPDINFPSNPTASQTYTFGFTTWTYNGNAWVAGGGSIGTQGFTGPQGFQGFTGPQGSQGVQGSQGTQGYTGPQGQPGTSTSFFNYLASTASQTGYPGLGNIIWNNTTQISATAINVAHLTNDSVDIDIILATLYVGQILVIQDADVSGNYQKWLISGTSKNFNPNTNTSYWEYPVTISTYSGTFSFFDGQPIVLATIAQSSEGPQGVQGPTGSQGTAGSAGSQGPTGPSDIINIYDVNDGTLVSGTTNNTLSDSVLISANSVTIGNFLELKTRYRITGNANTKTVRFYIGTASQISGANLVGTSAAIGGTILTGTMNRTLAIKSATQSESYPSTSAAHSDEGVIVAAAVTSTNIDWTLDQYFIVAIQLTSSGDSARTSFSKVTIYN